MNSPAVTILMPAFNAGKFIASSIRSALAQDFADFELLVIDDGSTDNTAAVVAGFADERVRLMRHETNCGLVATLNEGVRASRGPLVARQDADDLSRPDRLSRQLAYMQSHPADIAVASEARLVDERGRSAGVLRLPRTRGQLRWDLCFRNPIPHSSVMMRREPVLSEYGGYPDSVSSEDYLLWSRIAFDDRFGVIKTQLVSYRIHSSSAMKSPSSMATAYGIDTSDPRGAMAEAAKGVSSVRNRNLEAAVGTFVDGARRSALLEAWENPSQINWRDYVPVFESAAAGFEKRHGTLGRMPGIEYQTLISSGAPSVEKLFPALVRHAPHRLSSVPWHRIVGASVLRKF